MPAVVHISSTLVDGLDVASAGELQVALDAGANPADVSFAGPGKQAFELRQAIAAGVLINVESRARSDGGGGAVGADAAPGAGCSASQPGFRAEVIGHEDGRRGEAVRG